MGHELTVEGLRPSKQKVEAIENMPAPEDKAGLQRLLGMATYPELLNNGNEFRWDDRHQMAFNKLKEMLNTRPVLHYFDPTKPVEIQADASQSGLGAVLQVDGKVVE